MHASKRLVFIICVVMAGLIYVTIYVKDADKITFQGVELNVPLPHSVESVNISSTSGAGTSSVVAGSSDDDAILARLAAIIASGEVGKGNVYNKDIGNVSCGRNRTFKGVEDLLCKKPPSFLPDYKNPCWIQDGALVCLPYFQLVGMPKCGTTDLFDRLLHHPDVLQNDGYLHKETLWWSGKRYGYHLANSHQIENFDKYLKYFSSVARTMQQNGTHHFITGDGTPRDLFDMGGWIKIPQNQGLPEPRILTPHLIRHVNPGMKILIILRDPVERLYSDYYFNKKGQLTPTGFDKAVNASIVLLHKCLQASSLRGCLYNRSMIVALNQNGKTRLHMGFYSIFVRDWLSVFPRRQILIMSAEVFHKDITNHMQKIFQFLNIRRLSLDELDTISSAGPKRVTLAKQKAEPMLARTRAILKRLYQPFNVDLAEILDNTDYLWQ